MNGDLLPWSWITGLLILCLGGLAGFFIARQTKGKHTRQLEQDLESTRKELAEYRHNVDRHFLKTSLLFNKLTDDYREIYEHMATGAQRLCSERPGSAELKLPDQDILPGMASPEQAGRETVQDQTESTTAGHDPERTQPVSASSVVGSEEKSLLQDKELPKKEEAQLGEEQSPLRDANLQDTRSIH